MHHMAIALPLAIFLFVAPFAHGGPMPMSESRDDGKWSEEKRDDGPMFADK